MANVISPQDLGQDQTNQQNQNNGANQAGQAPVQSGAPVTSSQVSNPNQQKGSGYTNIAKVIQANKGNQLGQTVGQNIQSSGSSAQDNLKNAQNQFQQQTSQNQTNTDQNKQLVSDVMNNAAQYVGENDQNNPNIAAGQRFSTLASGQYQGPTGLQNADQLQAQGQNVAQMGQALGTAGGRIGLLNQIVGKPQYTRGQQNLDNLLLGQSNDPALQAAKRQALTLQGKINTGLAGASAQGQQATNEAQAFGSDIQNQLGQNLSAQDKALQDQATQSQTARDTQFQQLQQAAAGGNLSPELAQALGITSGQQMFNIDPSKFLSENPLQASASNVASAQDYAKIQALNKLAGQYVDQPTKDILGKFQDQTQAGAFNANPAYTSDKDAFQKAYGATKSEYQSKLDPAQNADDWATKIYSAALSQTPQARQFLASAGINPGDSNLRGWATANAQTAHKNLADTKNLLNQTYGSGIYNVDQNSAYPALMNPGQNNQS